MTKTIIIQIMKMNQTTHLQILILVIIQMISKKVLQDVKHITIIMKMTNILQMTPRIKMTTTVMPPMNIKNVDVSIGRTKLVIKTMMPMNN